MVAAGGILRFQQGPPPISLHFKGKIRKIR
jgi:hypothetical protein